MAAAIGPAIPIEFVCRQCPHVCPAGGLACAMWWTSAQPPGRQLRTLRPASGHAVSASAVITPSADCRPILLEGSAGSVSYRRSCATIEPPQVQALLAVSGSASAVAVC